jgi:hypothetical protein
MAGYRPQRIKTNSLNGVADIVLGTSGKKRKVKITFVDEDNAGKEFILNAEDCPKYIKKGRFAVSLSGKKDRLNSMRPLEGSYIGKVQKFSSNKDEQPKPRHNFEWNYDYFVVILEITRGEFAGMTVPTTFRYHFVEADDGTVGIGHLKSKYTPELERFLDITGAWEQGAMKYMDNVLPNLQGRILRQKKEFRIELAGGWVDRLYSLSEEEISNKLIEEIPLEDDFSNSDELIDPNELPWEEENIK